MQHKLSTDVQRYSNRRRRNTRHRLLGCIAGILVFCITYAALLPAISQAAPYISEAVKSLVAPTYEYNPSDKYTSYTYSDNDIDVVVQLPADSNVPKDAILRVTPIKETNAQYASLASKAEKAVNGAVKQAQFYDISFYTERMEYIPVDDRAKVSINYSAPTMDVDSDIVVLHYDENDDNPITLDKTDFTEEPYTSEQELTFETDGFSVFAVVELTSMYQTVEGITGLENKSYIIAAVNNDNGKNADGTPNTLPVMISEAVGNNLQKRLTESFVYSDNKVTSVALTDYTNAVWTFEKAGTDTYYIGNSQGQYLSIPAREQLTLSGDKQEFRVVAATNLNANNGNVMNAVCIQAVDNSLYVDLAANNVTDENRPFTSYDETTNNHGHHLVLVEYVEPQTIDLSNLVGKNYIIVGVNNTQNDVVTKTNLPVLIANETKYNNIDPVLGNRTTEDAVYVNNHVMAVTLVDTDKALWTFEKAESYDNAYYIKNTTTNTYLHLDNRSLTLSEQPQAIEALKAGGFAAGDDENAIYLRTVDAPHYYVNLVGNGNYTCFFGYNPGGSDDRGNHIVLIEYEEHQVTMPVISDADVNNLGGKKIVITNVNGVAITGTAFDADNNGSVDHLEEKQVTIENGQSAVTISSESSADLVWEFVATETPGQYYIKHVATGKYMNIYATGVGGNKPLTVEETNNPQAIQVLSANADNNPNAVWFRFPQLLYTNDDDDNNDNDYNAIDRYGDGFAVWNKSSADTQNQFLLSEYSDLPMMDAVDPTVAANNLDGKTMVITAAGYNTAMSNTTTAIGNRNWLKAQEAAEKNGTVGVVAGTNLADVSWTFTSVHNGQANQYYITDSNGKYLNINGTSVALSADNKQPISVYLNNDGTFVLCATVDGKEYLLDFSRGDNAFSAWDRAHDKAEGNNKFNLTPVEQFEQNSEVVTNLDGKTLALISIYDLNPAGTTPKYAVTSDVDDSNQNALHGVAVELSGNTGKAYTFDDEKFTNNQELWTFEAVDDKLGVYHIKAANGNYLNIGNNTATVSGDSQDITVLTETINGEDGRTYDVVYLRAEVGGEYYYLSRDANGYDTDLFGRNDVEKAKRLLLAQPSTIYIDVEKEGLNLDTEDWLFKPHFVIDDEDKDWSITNKEEFVKTGGTLPTSGELGAEPVENTRNGTSGVRHFVSFNFAESLDPYTAGKGRDFPQAYMASWAPELDANGNGYIDPIERGDTNGDGKVDGNDNPADKANFIKTLKDAVYDPDDFTGESPYWGVEYELTHYEVTLPNGSKLKDGSGNNAKFAPGTEYRVTADGMIEITGVDNITYKVPYGSTFKAQYSEFSDILTFYINLYGVVADIAADIQPRYIEDFTLGLAIAHIYYPGQYAGDTDEDYNKSNDYINSLFKGAYGENVAPGKMHAVIDGFINRSGPENRGEANLKDPEIQRYLSNSMTPALGASATALAAHVLDYVRTVPDIDIMLKKYVSGNNEPQPTLNNQTIDTATFEVRWYVVKDQGDSWHIDGVTIGKTEPIPVTKTFYGLDTSTVNGLVNYERSNDQNISGETHYTDTGNYKIRVSVNDDDKYSPYYDMQPYDQSDWEKKFYYTVKENDKEVTKTCQDPNLNPAIDGLYSYNGGTNPYSWTMSAILRQQYELTEQNYDFQYKDENGVLQYYDRVSKVTVKNKNGTSTDMFGTSAQVTGGTTASVEFNNYYTLKDTGMFIVKKISSVTGLPLAGAEFTLYDANNKVLDTKTTNADGEAAFYNLNNGTYILKETSAPDGFVVSNDEWPISVENGKVTYNGKTLYPVEVTEGDNHVTTITPLDIENAPSTTTVKVIKQFVGISKEQVDKLADSYSIVMQPNVADKDTYTLKLTESNGITPVVSADGLTYTWTLTNVPEIGYTVTESNFKLKNYVTTVSVEGFKFKDEDGNVIYYTKVTEPVVANDTATFTATFDVDYEDGFTIYNSYANDFSMQIKKVDSTNQNPLSGATFEVYGDHFIATDSKHVVVNGTTLYYLGTVNTDANGVATFTGWEDDEKVFHKLVLGYPYALVETKAPDGYNLLTEPIYLGVVNAEGVYWGDEKTNPDPDNLVFSNGVYSITVKNTPGYILPETGGAGTQLYTFGGLLLMAVPLMYGYKRKRAWKGGEMA